MSTKSLLIQASSTNIRTAFGGPSRCISTNGALRSLSNLRLTLVRSLYRPSAYPVEKNERGLHKFISTSQLRNNFSSGSGGILNRIRGFIETRQEEKKLEKIKQQIETMASLPTWNLKTFVNEIDSALSDWTTKIPGMSNTKAINGMKESKKILSVFVEELGENAEIDALVNMNRKQKVRQLELQKH